jgi:uncharacterized protein (TIGR00730 family)
MHTRRRKVKKTVQQIPMKAYKNLDFLSSPDARAIRMLSEFLEPSGRLRRAGIRDTIVFFGSARLKSRKEALREFRKVEHIVSERTRTSSALMKQFQDARTDLEMSRYYEDAVQLAKLLTQWSKKLFHLSRFVVCSGGGPGIMEAANRGAHEAGGRSIGLNISLPFEQYPNKFISKELNFEFHYFFMRKFWFVYLSKALIVFPGGFGTFDELMEVLTLLQTRKLRKKITVVLYGKEFWDKVIDIDALIRMRLVSASDVNLFSYANSPEEAFEYLVRELRKNYPDETKEGRRSRRIDK